MEIFRVFGMLGMLEWIVLIVVVLFIAVILGMILAYLFMREKRWLSSLEDGVSYFQDIPSSSFFFLREEEASTGRIYIINRSDKEKMHIVGGMESIVDSPFCIRRNGDKYHIYPRNRWTGQSKKGE